MSGEMFEREFPTEWERTESTLHNPIHLSIDGRSVPVEVSTTRRSTDKLILLTIVLGAAVYGTLVAAIVAAVQ